MYTDKLIKELITCQKKIIEPPKEIRGRTSFLKRSFTLTSVDGNYNFNGFITQSLKFNENFSIGLVFNPKEEKGTIVLIRCNGPHGGTKATLHHAVCHIHIATADRINIGLKPEGSIEETKEYSTIEDAIQFYVKHINLLPDDKQKYFPPLSGQISLFEQSKID